MTNTRSALSRGASPYGSWASPITAQLLTHAAVGLGELKADGGVVYWVESRPMEAGRSVIVGRAADGGVGDVSPAGFNARTRAHEYGGGAYAVRGGVVVAASFEDQRVYRLDDGEPTPITPKPEQEAGDRYADFVLVGDRAICIRERHHREREPSNELVAVPLDGSSEPVTLDSGHDFVSSPCVSPDGARLAWLTWNHPHMPWDATELWTADIDGSVLDNVRRVAGGTSESIFQPGFSPDGRLHFVSDRTGWWNLYRLEPDGTQVALWPKDAEFGSPQWQFGSAHYGFLEGGRLVAVYRDRGSSHLAVIDGSGPRSVPLDWNHLEPTLACDGTRVWLIASGPTSPAAVIAVDPEDPPEVIRRSLSVEIDARYISSPQEIAFPTADGAEAHAFFYPPNNPAFTATEGELPPLVVWTHGGPTGATAPGFNLGIQYWTSRGFAIVDVNYRGSTGYGREYRNALRQQWGIVDTLDCIAAAQWLADTGVVDPLRMAIRGGSAGGYTTLCAVTFHNVFAAAASYFGVSDCEALARDTHKFESRYLDGLIGPYLDAADRYRERSPIHHTDRLSTPIILFQGLDDRVVTPDQATVMAKALAARGIPHACLMFPGEGHGFRRAETIERAVEAELAFYGKVFGFQPADEIAPLDIKNLT